MWKKINLGSKSLGKYEENCSKTLLFSFFIFLENRLIIFFFKLVLGKKLYASYSVPWADCSQKNLDFCRFLKLWSYVQFKFENFSKTLLFEFLSFFQTLLFCSFIIFNITRNQYTIRLY